MPEGKTEECMGVDRVDLLTTPELKGLWIPGGHKIGVITTQLSSPVFINQSSSKRGLKG